MSAVTVRIGAAGRDDDRAAFIDGVRSARVHRRRSVGCETDHDRVVVRDAELVRGVQADELPSALEVFEIIQHAGFVGVDVVVAHAGDLRHKRGRAERVIEIAPLPVEDVGVGIRAEEGFRSGW